MAPDAWRSCDSMADLMHMAREAAADKPKPSPPPGAKATTGDIVKPLAAAKGAMEAVDAHIDKTGVRRRRDVH